MRGLCPHSRLRELRSLKDPAIQGRQGVFFRGTQNAPLPFLHTGGLGDGVPRQGRDESKPRSGRAPASADIFYIFPEKGVDKQRVV